MKQVVFIGHKSSDLTNWLTIGKIYNLIGSGGVTEKYFRVKNDKNQIRSYHARYFLSLQEWRNKQINNILC